MAASWPSSRAGGSSETFGVSRYAIIRRSWSRSRDTCRRTPTTSSRGPTERAVARAAAAVARRARGRRCGCGSSGSGSPPVPTVAPAKTFHLAGFEPPHPCGRTRPSRSRSTSSCRPARRSRSSARSRPAHRRAPDPRTRRPVGDRAPPPEDPARRHGAPVDHLSKAGQVPRAGRRLPGRPRHAAARELPADDERDRERRGQASAAAAVQPRCHRRRLPGADREDAAHLGVPTVVRDAPDHRREGAFTASRAVVRRARTTRSSSVPARSPTSTRTSARRRHRAARASSAARR